MNGFKAYNIIILIIRIPWKTNFNLVMAIRVGVLIDRGEKLISLRGVPFQVMLIDPEPTKPTTHAQSLTSGPLRYHI